MIKKIVASSLISLMALGGVYIVIEPSITSAVTDNVTVTLTVDSGITISNGADSTMLPNMSITQNSSVGSSSWTVSTNSYSGYTLAVKASASPAMTRTTGTASFADFSEASAGVPETWSVSNAYEFGYSAWSNPGNTDVPTATWGTDTDCVGGTSDVPSATLKYVSFKTTDKIIAQRATVTPTGGITSNICFAAAQNGVYAPSGNYSALITATASSL